MSLINIYLNNFRDGKKPLNNFKLLERQNYLKGTTPSHIKTIYTYVKDEKPQNLQIGSLKLAEKICNDWSNQLINNDLTIILQDNKIEKNEDEESKTEILSNDELNNFLNQKNFKQELSGLISESFGLGFGLIIVDVELKNFKEPKLLFLAADKIEVYEIHNKEIIGFYITKNINNDLSAIIDYFYDVEKNETIIKYYKITNPNKHNNQKTKIVLEGQMTYPFKIFCELRSGLFYKDWMGACIFENVFDVLDNLDIHYHQLQIELKTGQRKLILSENLISDNSKIKSLQNSDLERERRNLIRTFDIDQQLILVVKNTTQNNLVNNDISSVIKDFNPNFRTEKILEVIEFDLGLIAENVGFGVGFYSYSQKSTTKTATEIISNNENYIKAKANHLAILENTLMQFVNILLNMFKFLQDDLKDGIPFQKLDWVNCYVNFNSELTNELKLKKQIGLELFKEGVLARKTLLMDYFNFNETDVEENEQRLKNEQSEFDTNNIGLLDNIDI